MKAIKKDYSFEDLIFINAFTDEAWIPLSDDVLPKTKGVFTMHLMGRGQDAQGDFILIIKHYAESDTANTHKSGGGITHIMDIATFQERHREYCRAYGHFTFDDRRIVH